MDPRLLQDAIDSSQKYLIIVITVVSALSMVGSLFILATYLSFKSVRNMAFKLVFHLAIADIICTTGNLLSVAQYNSSSDKICYIQALLVNFGELSSIMWTMLIAYTIFTVVRTSSQSSLKGMTLFRIIGYGIPLAMTILPIVTNQFGKAGAWCWIKETEESRVWASILRMIEFYIPLWIAIIFNTVILYKASRKLKKIVSTTVEKRFAMRLRLYPMILIICWTFGTINRFYNMAGKDSAVLNILHIAFGGLQGFFNALVYGMTNTIRMMYYKKCANSWLCGCCCRCFGLDAEKEMDKVRLRDQVDKKEGEQGEQGGMEIDMKDAREIGGDLGFGFTDFLPRNK